jgi:hypothetical protein
MESISPAAYPDEGGESKPEDFRCGLLSFRLKVQNMGDMASAVVYFSEPQPNTYDWYKYGLVKGWHIYTEVDFNEDRRFLAFTLMDGGNGDIDGSANGVIVDPVGAGSKAPGAVVVPISGSAGIDGSGGVCFIEAAFDTTGIDTVKSRSGRWLPILLFFALASIFSRYRF